MERLYRLVTRRPAAILVFVLAATLILGLFARRIEIDSSLDALLPTGDPAKAFSDEMREVFGSDEIGVVGVFTENVYAAATLEKIRRITEAIEEIPGVQDVWSLTSAVDPVESVVEPPPLVPHLPRTPAERTALRAKVEDRSIYVKNLVSADGRAAAINVTFRPMSDAEFFRSGIDGEIERIVEEARGPEEIFYTGLPHYRVHSVKAMWADLAWLVPATLGVILVVLFASFHTLRGMLLPTLVALTSLVWTLGLMVLAGSKLSLGNLALPPLILVIATVYALHVVAEHADRARAGGERRDVVLATLRQAGTPIFITAVTTALGFLSLVVNRIPSIRELGVFAAIGIGLAFVFTITIAPAVLTLLPLRSRVRAESPRLAAALRALGRFDIGNRRAILVAALVVGAVAVTQVFRIQVDTNFQSFFPKTDPIRIATDRIDAELVGSMTFSVVLEGETPRAMRRIETLERIRDLQGFIASRAGVDKTVSFVDYLELLDRGAQTGGGGLVLDESGELVEAPRNENPTTFWENPSQLDEIVPLVLSNPRAFSRVVDPELRRSSILVRTTLSRTRAIRDLAGEIVGYAKSRFPPEIRVRPTGSLILLTRSARDIVAGQVQSLAIAAGVIFVIMSFMFLSARIGLFAMVPNVFPILVFFGLVGACGIDLNLGTSVIAAIALGIAVDDTIHVLARLSAEVKRMPDQESAILETLATVGKPIVFTTLILIPGFLTLAFSTFVPLREFGILSAATMALALVGDLVILPAMVSTLRIITLWDLLNLKLGEEPHRTIPLFETLRPYQAKIVALLSELRRYEKGATILHRGELADAMYVVIDGAAEVLIGDGENRRRVREVRRGDVVGEMGLVRKGRRTADVVATTDTEVMAIDDRVLRRLLQRYPFTANKILLNLSRILSDRLEQATDDSGRPA